MSEARTLRSTLDRALRGYAQARGVGPAGLNVPRIKAPALPLFETYYRHPPRPVVFEGLANDWPARRTWSLESLRERFGSRLVTTLPTRNGTLETDGKRGLSFRKMPLSEYLDLLATGNDPGLYLVAPIDQLLPELKQDAVEPVYTRARPWKNSRFWLSAAHTTTPLHRDVAENCFAQIVGRKHFYLYAPDASPWLYSNSFRSGMPNFSRFDPAKPDYERFPLAREVRPAEIVLEPGDVLYLPSRWWHQPRSLDVSMSMNFWWADGALEKVVRLAEWVKRVRGLEIYGLKD